MPLDTENEGVLKVHDITKLQAILRANKKRLSSEFSKSKSNRLEDDLFEGKPHTNELPLDVSFLRQNASNLQPTMQRISRASITTLSDTESIIPHTLLKEKIEYFPRKKKMNRQVEQWYSMYIFLKCTSVLGHTKIPEPIELYQEMLDTIQLLVKNKKHIKVDGHTEVKVSDFREFKGKYDNILEKEYDLKQEIESKLNFNEMKKKKHQENIYRQWTKKVYNPLFNRVQESIQSPTSLFTSSKKHGIYKTYLKYVNTKGNVFLDTTDPEEYSTYPYPNKVPGKVDVIDQDNPLHFNSQLYDEEQQVILSLLTGKNYSKNDIVNLKLLSHPVSSSSRQKMDATKWLLMPENNILSTPRTASRRKIHAGRYNKSMLSESLLTKYKNMKNQRLSSLQNNKLEEI